MDSQHTPPTIPPTQDVLPLDMNNLASWILTTLRNYGLPFLLLGVAVWYFHNRTEKLETAIELCQKNHLETIEIQNGALIRALNDNTQALNRLEANIFKK